MDSRLCRHCGSPIPAGSRSKYCSVRCRRKYQDARRMDERHEHSERLAPGECIVCGKPFKRRHEHHFCCSRKCHSRAEKRGLEAYYAPMDDPWQRNDLDEWTALEMFENACLDPLPAGMDGLTIGGAMAVIQRKRKRLENAPRLDTEGDPKRKRGNDFGG